MAMAVSKPTPIDAARRGPSLAVVGLSRGSRGVPATVTLRASAVADLMDELAAARAEGHDFASRVQTGAGRIIAAASAGSRLAVVNEAGKLSYLASRRLRQLDGGDAA